MEPASFEQVNKVFIPPEGVSEDTIRSIGVHIGVYDDGSPHIVQAWKPDLEDMKRLQAGGRIWITLLTHSLPAIHVGTEDPFEAENPET